MKLRRQVFVYIAVFAALLLSLYLLTVLFAALPNAAIQNNMRRSARYFVNADPYAFSEDGLYQNITDNYADQIWTNIGWNMGRGNPFRTTLDTRYTDAEQFDGSAGLHLAVSKGYEANVDYARYWHGTAAVIRVLHMFFSIRGIRTLGLLFLLVLVFRTFLVLCRLGHWELGLCMLLSLYFVQVWNLRLSVEYLPCFLICFGLCPAFLRLERRGDFSLNVLSIIAGTLTAFFDFLTTETVTILLPLILVIAIRSAERRLGSPRRVMKTLAGCILCWTAAYLGAFAVKWMAVSLVTGENYLVTALSAAEKRVGGAVSGAIPQKTNLFMALGANFSVLFEGSSRIEVGRVLAYLAILAVVILVIIRLYRFRSKTYPGTGFLLLLGSLIFLRYSVLANHSYMHAFFTYRAMCITILAILCAMVINLRPGKKKGYRKEWN